MATSVYKERKCEYPPYKALSGWCTVHPFAKKREERGQWSIRRVPSRMLCLTLVVRGVECLLKSVSGAGKYTGILGRMSMKLQSKHGGSMSV
eukprot:1150553-Pelagomonas_calceolata.AAC.12